MFEIAGFMDVVYPCEDGDYMQGKAEVSINAPGMLEVADLIANVTYRCGGDDNSDTAVVDNVSKDTSPRLTISLESVDPVRVAKVTLSDFHLMADLIPKDDAFGDIAGVVTGTAITSVGGWAQAYTDA